MGLSDVEGNRGIWRQGASCKASRYSKSWPRRCTGSCLLHKKAFHFSKLSTSDYQDTVKWTTEAEAATDGHSQYAQFAPNSSTSHLRAALPCSLHDRQPTLSFKCGGAGRTWWPWGHSEKGNSPLRYSHSQSWSIGDGFWPGFDDFLGEWLFRNRQGLCSSAGMRGG
jgi:hypothetical protein